MRGQAMPFIFMSTGSITKRAKFPRQSSLPEGVRSRVGSSQVMRSEASRSTCAYSSRSPRTAHAGWLNEIVSFRSSIDRKTMWVSFSTGTCLGSSFRTACILRWAVTTEMITQHPDECNPEKGPAPSTRKLTTAHDEREEVFCLCAGANATRLDFPRSRFHCYLSQKNIRTTSEPKQQNRNYQMVLRTRQAAESCYFGQLPVVSWIRCHSASGFVNSASSNWGLPRFLDHDFSPAEPQDPSSWAVVSCTCRWCRPFSGLHSCGCWCNHLV